jgi:hypothetical protein
MRAATARRPSPHRTLVVGLAAAAIAVTSVVVVVATRPDTEGTTSSPGLVRTGEVNEMGLPVVTTPGSPSGRASAGGVEVTGATWRMGQVPLQVAVRPIWTLVNTSGRPVALGEPHPEVRAGCCPGPLVLGARELLPGESTTLTFELSMHPGMDGWHDIAVHVPVLSAGGRESILDLAVTGDFRGALAA